MSIPPTTPGLHELPRAHEENTSEQAAAALVVESAAAVEAVARPCLSNLPDEPFLVSFNAFNRCDLAIISCVSSTFRAAVLESVRATSINAMNVFVGLFSQSKLLPVESSFHIYEPGQLEGCSKNMMQLMTFNNRLRKFEVVDLLAKLPEAQYNNIKMHFSHNRLPLGFEDVFVLAGENRERIQRAAEGFRPLRIGEGFADLVRRVEAEPPRRGMQFVSAALRMDPDIVAAAAFAEFAEEALLPF